MTTINNRTTTTTQSALQVNDNGCGKAAEPTVGVFGGAGFDVVGVVTIGEVAAAATSGSCCRSFV